jgi:poly-beta-1,6-N-acetyl-D-glucosamine synthase
MMLTETIQALLDLNYPELEVIVVADRVADASVEALKAEWALEPREMFYRRTLPTAPVHRMYASERESRLIVVEKAAGGRADALNFGASLARYRYVVSVTPEVQFDANALLRLMAPALRDPGTVLAVTSYVERKHASAAASTGTADEWTAAGEDFQRLRSIRSWMASRLAWHQLSCGVPPRDGVSAFRRDVILTLGGFSLDAADPEFDLLIRLQTQPDGSTGRVVRTSEVFGHAGALRDSEVAAAAALRRRALHEAFRTLSEKEEGSNGRLRVMMKSVLAVELITPVAQVFVLIAMIVGTVIGALDWNAPFLALLFLTFGYGLVSAAGLLLRGGTPGAPVGQDLKRLLLRAPLEFVVYMPALLWARRSAAR